MLRDLQSNLVGRIICIPGIITSTSKTAVRARTVVYKCSSCGHEKRSEVPMGLAGTNPPRICDNAKNPGLDK
jgi:DNA replicative helicase MCM subunit Mcm2 (Cdc46/Mcm family)